MKITASRPRLPEEYGVPADTGSLLPWSFVTGRMASALHYWLTTVTDLPAPHPRPIDGLWLDDSLFFGGSPKSRWVVNLMANARATIHLEDAEQAVILHGEVRFIRPDGILAARLADLSNRKYGQNQLPADYEGVVIARFVPGVVFGWQVLFEDATRWQLAPE